MALVHARVCAPSPAATAGRRAISTPSRANIIAKSNTGAFLSATAASILLVASPVWANTNQFEESQTIEQEMVELIKTRSKGKAVLEVKEIENEVPVLAVEEAPVVTAAMTAEERSEAIRAEAVRQATGATSAQISRSRGGSLQARSTGDAGNGGAAVLGLALVAAAVGGAYYYQNNLATGEAASPAGTTSGSQPAAPADIPSSEREQSPAPTA